MAYLEGTNLVAAYGVVPILHECSVEVEKGELAVIVGPNGAGKSTVMRVLLGMLEATAGEVKLDGQDISMLSTQERISLGLAFVPQNKNVFPSMTVEENLEMGGFLRLDDINKTIEEVYSLFPILYEKRKQLAEELSGGQRQRLAIARAIYLDPPVLIFDEATSSLDAHSERKVQEAIETLHGKRTVIVVAHRLATVASADYIYVLENGSLAEEGTHEQLKSGNGLYSHLCVKQSLK